MSDKHTHTCSRIHLIDDHPVVRSGMKAFLNGEPDIEVCGESAGPQQALAAVAKSQPDLVLVDIGLGETSGLDLIRNLRNHCERTRILVLSMYDEAMYAERALRAGGHGYVMKSEPPETILKAIRHVLAGEVYTSSGVASRLMKRAVGAGAGEQPSPLSSLSDRELEVFRMLGQGLTTREIANTLHLSIKTVETYREHLKRKLNLENASQLIRCAVEWAKE
ncbi:MAG: response regulator transcription factor [Planctomycetes bacterium]|nr:response regulator transcription factor [Planctomycetota bacterium]